MAAKIEQQTNFKSTEEFSNWLSCAVSKLDRSKSEVIRCCIMLALPTIVANPSLIDHVVFNNYIRQHNGVCQ